MGFDRGVDDGDVDLVVDDIDDGGHELGAAGDAGLAGLQVHLHAEALGEVTQQLAEAVHRVAGAVKAIPPPRLTQSTAASTSA